MKKIFFCIFLLSIIVFGISTSFANAAVDLQPTSITYNNANLTVGKAISFDSGVKNSGTTDSGVFNIKWYVNDVQLGYGSHASVAANSTVMDGNSQFTWTPSQPGKYTVTFVVDADNGIVESNENNNKYSVTFSIYPDLQPTSITYNSTNLTVGKAIAFDSGVKNNGGAATGVFNIKWFVNDVQVGYGSHSGVAPYTTVMDGNSQLTWTPNQPGNYTVKFVVDSDNGVVESSDTNNSTSVTFSIYPDLKPTSITYNNSNLTVGKAIAFDTGVKNDGGANTGVFNIKWYVNDVQSGYGSHSSLAPYTTVMDGNSQFTWTPSQPGKYTVKFVVDADNGVVESSDTNNSTSVTFSIYPDLKPESITYNNSNLTVGKAIAFDTGVKNDGGANSGVFNIKWYVNDVQVGYGSHASVAPYTTVMDGNSQLTWTPSQPGKYTVKFVVDADNSVVESSDTNNSTSVTFSIYPDLQPTSINYSNSNLTVGNAIFFDSGVKNNGGANTGVFNIKWYVNDAELGYGSHASLAPYTTVLDGNSQFTWTPTQPGKYTVKFVVDADNGVVESSDTNNSTTVTFTIYPDLQPTSITYNKTNIGAGRAIFFDSGIKNNGGASSGVFNIKWYVNDAQVGYGSHASVAPYTTVMDGNSQLTWTPAQSGTYTVAFVVDADNGVVEGSESNNKTTVTVTVP